MEAKKPEAIVMVHDPKRDFIEALVKAQLEFKPVAKSATNPFFKSSYAPYEEVWSSVGRPLNSNGFAVLHQTKIEDGNFIIITRLIHVSGHEEYSEHQIPNSTTNMQDKGKAETYGKRYNLVALTAVPVGGDDDDGNAACANGDKKSNKADLLLQINKKKQELPSENLENFKKWVTNKYKVNRVEQLAEHQVKEVLLELEASLRRNKAKGENHD